MVDCEGRTCFYSKLDASGAIISDLKFVRFMLRNRTYLLLDNILFVIILLCLTRPFEYLRTTN